MSKADETYAGLLKKIRDEGETGPSRPGINTLSLFGAQMRFNLQEGFPLLTTKKVWWYGIVQELLWFLRGETNIRSLQEAGVHIWDEWADANGDLGPVYGSQWRSWPGDIDQIADVIESIRLNPMGRRHMVTAWNPAEIPDMKLPPCHCLFQFKVMPESETLNLQLYQRSADMFLGVPFNIASYALLLRMVAHVTGYKPGEFIWTGGDVHIYENHLAQVDEQLSRTGVDAPGVGLDINVKEIDDFTVDNIYLVNYNPLPAIAAKVAV